MAEMVRLRPARYWLVFVGIALGLWFLKLLPVGGHGGGVPGPDLILCIVLAWVLRRPEYIPAVLIAVVLLIEDFLLLRPPGLWALLVLLAAEFLRGRQTLMRELGFVLEWAIVGALMLMMWMAERLILGILMVPVQPMTLSLAHLLTTFLAYPAVVAVSHVLLRVRKPARGEVDALGRPL